MGERVQVVSLPVLSGPGASGGVVRPGRQYGFTVRGYILGAGRQEVIDLLKLGTRKAEIARQLRVKWHCGATNATWNTYLREVERQAVADGVLDPHRAVEPAKTRTSGFWHNEGNQVMEEMLAAGEPVRAICARLSALAGEEISRGMVHGRLHRSAKRQARVLSMVEVLAKRGRSLQQISDELSASLGGVPRKLETIERLISELRRAGRLPAGDGAGPVVVANDAVTPGPASGDMSQDMSGDLSRDMARLSDPGAALPGEPINLAIWAASGEGSDHPVADIMPPHQSPVRGECRFVHGDVSASDAPPDANLAGGWAYCGAPVQGVQGLSHGSGGGLGRFYCAKHRKRMTLPPRVRTLKAVN